MNFRLQPEFAGVGLIERRPKRLTFPQLFLQIGRRSSKWRDYPSSRTFSDMLDGHAQSSDGSRHTRQAGQSEQPITDQTFPEFLKHLRIRLPVWHQKPLDQQLAEYLEQEEQRKRGHTR